MAVLLSSAPVQAQSVFSHNLIVNGNAELGPGNDGSSAPASIPGWTAAGSPRVISYASGFDLSPTSIIPANHGNNYFAGGQGQATSSLTQSIDLSSGGSTIDGGNVTFDVSGYLGGQGEDTATLSLAFLGTSGNQLNTVTLGPITQDDKSDSSALYLRRNIGPVPSGARKAVLTLTMTRSSGGNNDGYADSLRLVLNNPGAPGTLVDTNLISNSGAESAPAGSSGIAADVPNWVRTSEFSTDSYADQSGDLNAQSPGPSDRGLNYFWGGSGEQQSAYQDIDLSAAASLIDGGHMNYALSAWLGGFADQNDSTTLTANFEKWDGTSLAVATLNPVMAADRNNASSLIQRSQSGTIPAGARMVRITMTMNRTDGSDNDGLAENLSLTLSSSGVTGIPAISADGIQSAGAFGAFSAIAPAGWIEIFGSNLAQTARSWQGGDFQGSNAPTSLSGVSVRVAGQPAYVSYISPGQVNVQVPSNVASGFQDVTVTTGNGTSQSYNLNVNAMEPGLLAPPSFLVDGKQYVVAQALDGTFLLPPDTIPGVVTRQARPGETIIIYGIGFGPVSPDTPAGQIVGGQNQLTNPVTMKFGDATAALGYQGLAPSFVGLYQFNVTVPGVPDNDLTPLSFTQNGEAAPQQLFIAVKR